METVSTHRHQRRIIWGALLAMDGVLMLADQLLGIWSFPIQQWWPTILVLIGLVWLLDGPRPKRVAKGVFLMALGLWLLACNVGLWGLSLMTSWPFVLIAAGVAMVLSSVMLLRFSAVEDCRHVR